MLETILTEIAKQGPLGLVCALLVWLHIKKDALIQTKDDYIAKVHERHQDQILSLGNKATELSKELAIAFAEETSRELARPSFDDKDK